MNNLLKRVDEELQSCKNFNPVMAFGMLEVRKMIAEESRGIISFHRLNGLNPTIESSTFKVLEEIGEVFQMLGKGQGLNGEGEYARKLIEDTEFNILLACEVIDMAQASVSLAHAICSYYGIIIDDIMTAHEKKLREKGYLI